MNISGADLTRFMYRFDWADMACRIGPFAGHFYKEIHKLGGTVYLNPDGHEWMEQFP